MITMGLDLWHDIMYCVGVFVTCNVGGVALLAAIGGASARIKRRAVAESAEGDAGRRPKPRLFDWRACEEADSRPEDEAAADAQENSGRTQSDGQSFEDMQRQIQEERESVSDGSE